MREAKTVFSFNFGKEAKVCNKASIQRLEWWELPTAPILWSVPVCSREQLLACYLKKKFSIFFWYGGKLSGKLFFPAVPILWITMRLEYWVNCKEVVDDEFEHLKRSNSIYQHEHVIAQEWKANKNTWEAFQSSKEMSLYDARANYSCFQEKQRTTTSVSRVRGRELIKCLVKKRRAFGQQDVTIQAWGVLSHIMTDQSVCGFTIVVPKVSFAFERWLPAEQQKSIQQY